MIERTYKFELPYYINGWLLNRNKYIEESSSTKRIIKDVCYNYFEKVVPKMTLHTIRTDYVFHQRNYKRNDKNNVCGLIDKILMDYLVTKGYLIDDGNAFVKETKFRLGAADFKNPRVAVTIKANKIPKNLARKN